MKKMLEADLLLVENAKCLIGKIGNKKVFLYAAQSIDLFIEKFIQICSRDTVTVIVGPDYMLEDGEYVIPAVQLPLFFSQLKEQNICDEQEYQRLRSIRYSQNDWEIRTGNLILHVVEKKLCFYIYQKLYEKKSEEMTIAFHIIDHCNLNCQMCNKYSPIAEQRFVSSDSVIKDSARLSKLAPRGFKRILLTGGEPLLHSQLESIVEGIHFYFPNTTIQLQTNGLLLKNKTRNFFEFCKKYGVLFWITPYPIDYDYCGLFEKIKNLGCQIEWAIDGSEKTSWRFPLDIDGRQEKIWMFFCWMRGECTNCVEGKIYPCGLMHASQIFEKKFDCHFDRQEDDCIDIYKVSSFCEITSFLASYQPFCRYCNIKEWEIDIPWKISKRSVCEWI